MILRLPVCYGTGGAVTVEKLLPGFEEQCIGSGANFAGNNCPIGRSVRMVSDPIALAAQAQCYQHKVATCTPAQPPCCWYDSCRTMEMVLCHPWLLLMVTRFSWGPDFYLRGVPGHVCFGIIPMLKSARPPKSTASSSMLKTGLSRVSRLSRLLPAIAMYMKPISLSIAQLANGIPKKVY